MFTSFLDQMFFHYFSKQTSRSGFIGHLKKGFRIEVRFYTSSRIFCVRPKMPKKTIVLVILCIIKLIFLRNSCDITLLAQVY